MRIVHYPHPALRWKSADVQRIDGALRRTIRGMFDLMYEAKGIGLAANQVGLPLRFFIVNLHGEPTTPEDELVFINPLIRKQRGAVVGEEGCLSLPGLYSDVSRWDEVTIEAFDLEGRGFQMRLNELPARVVQHETDHLDGILFIDRLDDDARAILAPKVAEFVAAGGRDPASGGLPPEDALRQQLEAIASSGGVPAEW